MQGPAAEQKLTKICRNSHHLQESKDQMDNNHTSAAGKCLLFLLSVSASVFPFLRFDQVLTAPSNSVVPDALTSIGSALTGTAVVSAILCCAFFMLGMRRYDKDLPAKPAFILYSIFLALVWLTAESFRIDNTLHYLNADAGQVLKSVIYLVGSSYLIFEALSAFCHLITQREEASARNTEKSSWNFTARIFAKIDSHPFLYPFAGILAAFALPVLACYPAFTCNDSWTEILQYLGYLDFTSHHPPVHILLVGLFCSAGRALGNMNAGLFGFVLFQMIVFAAVLAHTYRVMLYLKAPRWLRGFFLISAAFAPHYTNYICVIIKDSLYSIMLLLFIDEFVLALADPEAFFDQETSSGTKSFSEQEAFYGTKSFFGKKANYILFFLSVMGVLLFRNNGKHVLYPAFAVTIAAVIILRRKLGKKALLRSLALIAAPVLCAVLLESSLTAIYKIEKGSVAEALSFPFQQTARTVTEHGDEITPEEREAIDGVLDFDSLAVKYNPTICDPVKATYRAGADKAALARYLGTWFKMFFKYPLSYVKATLNQNYLLVYPFQENKAVYCRLFNYEKGRNELMETVKKETGLHNSNRFPVLRQIIYNLQKLLYSLPIAGLFLHHATYVILLFASLIVALHDKLYRYLLAALPILLSVVVIILAPVIKGHPRYAYPIMYSLPVLLAFFIFCRNKSKE